MSSTRARMAAIASLSLLAGTTACAGLMPDTPPGPHAHWAPRSKDSAQPWTSFEDAQTVAYDFRLRR